MSGTWTADGYAAGWPGGWTADGWPKLGVPITADGFVTPYGDAWTADGYAGSWPHGISADGWPIPADPFTADGYYPPFPAGSGGGGGVGSGHGGGGHHGHSGGGFNRRKRKKERPWRRLNDVFSDRPAPEIYEELSRSDKADQAAQIVRQHAKSEAAVPQVAAVDWNALSRNADSTGRLMALYHQHQIDLDDEDFWILGG